MANGHRAILISFALAVLLPSACARPDDGADAALVGFTQAQNRGDAAAAAGLFAPDGLYEGVLVCSPNACVGRVAVREALESEAIGGTHHLLHAPAALGARRLDEVRWSSLTSLADRVVCSVVVEMGTGGVTAMRFVPDYADGQTAHVLAAQARVREWLDDWAASGREGPLTLPFAAD
jgi:hypothetical protein